ncbi:hypothetical protein WICPIJ_002080 [Wickerhamomyces pijperi]|uniref:Uncharacterized protein n=1 Tax=Wickerhamomyces pijperi TaxID=599730 RepID=A0A9P8QCJ7_WICPI|nr:hypothetical protein WICPIJ_002080 [Wickerhamomyces pijperi]
MKFSTIASTVLLSSVIQAADTTTYSPEQLSSASAAALSADGQIIYDFVLDISANLQEYLNYIQTNKLNFPDDLYNYILNLEAADDTSKLPEMIATASFPFSDFVTFAPNFSQYSSIISKDGDFKTPGDFLTTSNGDATSTTTTAAAEASSTQSVAQSTEVPSAAVSSVSSSFSAVSSSVSSSVAKASSSASASSTKASTSSPNAANGLYVPVVGLTFLLAALL